jgi:hypothetical protein
MAPINTFSPKSLWALNAYSKSTALVLRACLNLPFAPTTQGEPFFTVPGSSILAGI